MYLLAGIALYLLAVIATCAALHEAHERGRIKGLDC